MSKIWENVLHKSQYNVLIIIQIYVLMFIVIDFFFEMKSFAYIVFTFTYINNLILFNPN